MEKFKGYFVPKKNEICIKKNDTYACVCHGDLISCAECIFGRLSEQQILVQAEYIATHLTPITNLYVPFGMLSKEKQKELIKANNNGNIQSFYGYYWVFLTTPEWNENTVYRLDPNYKSAEKNAEKKAELIKELEEMGAVVNGKIIM